MYSSLRGCHNINDIFGGEKYYTLKEKKMDATISSQAIYKNKGLFVSPN